MQPADRIVQKRHQHENADQIAQLHAASQNGDNALLDPIDQHALHRVHVLDYSRHQVARGAIVEPAQRQQLNVRIQIAAQIENDFLLECVVENDPKRIVNVLNKKSDSREQD